MTRKTHLFGALTIAASMAIGVSGQAAAEQVTLRTASAFAKGTAIPFTFDKFVEEINSDANAPVKLNYVGGPESMPPFQLGNAVRTGVVDVAFVTGAFYENLMPSAGALNLTEYSPQELREMGRWDDLQEIWREEMDVHFLAFTNYGNRFHLYTNKPLDTADLSGQRLRITPVYRAFFESLGADVAQTAPGEVYTALERGTVDGYGWPIQGVLDLGWHEHTRYRVEPGFYQVEVGVLVNQDAWERMTGEQRAYLTEKAVWLESLNELNDEINEREAKRQAEAGMEVIELTGAEREKFLDAAHEAKWQVLYEQDRETAERIRAVITK
ncbi:MAG: TRAP transporter substrate-binding protein DctP [Aquisalimonadaceae bacterium]